MFAILDTRGLVLSAEHRSKIRACTDLTTLDRWLRVAVTCTDVETLFGH